MDWLQIALRSTPSSERSNQVNSDTGHNPSNIYDANQIIEDDIKPHYLQVLSSHSQLEDEVEESQLSSPVPTKPSFQAEIVQDVSFLRETSPSPGQADVKSNVTSELNEVLVEDTNKAKDVHLLGCSVETFRFSTELVANVAQSSLDGVGSHKLRPFEKKKSVREAGTGTNVVPLKSRGVQYSVESRNIGCQTEDMSRSLFYFTNRNTIRKSARSIAMSRSFDKVLMVAVVGSTVCMLAMDPLQSLDAARNLPLLIVELVFTAIFLFETVLKVVAYGFLLTEESYLRTPWNILDFACVVSSVAFLLSIWMPVPRTFLIVRRLRPLTMIRQISSLKIRAEASIQTIVRLGGMLCLLLLFVLFMGAIGLELFKGEFRSRCILEDVLEDSTLANSAEERVDKYVSQLAGEDSLCGASSNNCGADEVCVDTGKNPNNGVTSFDNIVVASLVVFQSMTLEGWTDIQYFIQDSVSFYGGLVYMFLVVVFGALLIMNLALAVLYNSYMEQKEAQERAEKRQRELEKENSLREQAEMEEEVKRDEKQKDPTIVADDAHSSVESLDIHETSDSPRAQALKADLAVRKTSSGLSFLEGSFSRTSLLGGPVIDMDNDATEKSLLTSVVRSPKFEAFFNAVLFVNVVFLAMYSYKASVLVLGLISWVNVICALLFLIEFVLKVSALGLMEYLSDSYNCLDFFLVLVAVVEFIFQLAQTEGVGQTALALRALRIVRVAKFAKSWSAMREFVEALLMAWDNVRNLIGLMFIFMLTFALIGEEILAGLLGESRFHFDNSIMATITIFQVFTGENWNEGMYDSVQQIGWGAAPFFIVVFIVGNTFFFNFLVSILIDSSLERMRIEGKIKLRDSVLIAPETETVENKRRGILWMTAKFNLKRLKAEAKPELKLELTGKSFMLFSPSNPLRLFLAKVTRSHIFEFFILLTILVSTVTVALDNPHDEDKDPTMMEAFDILNVVAAIIFLFEMLMHMIAMGVWRNPDAYLRDGWNILDACIVAISFVSLLVPQIVFLRSLRAVRSLRIVSHNSKLKTVVLSLVQALQRSGHIFAVGFLLVMMFSVIGVNLFAGSFGLCLRHPEIEARRDCSGVAYNNATRVYEELEWFESKRNFNNVANGALVLAELASFEMWPDIMLLGVDSVGMDQAMRKNARFWVVLYFIPVLMIMAFLYLNLFVGVVVQTYKQVKKDDDTAHMPPLRRQWENNFRLIRSYRAIKDPRAKKNKFQNILYSIVTSAKFEIFFLFVVCLVFLSIAIQHFNQPDELTTAVDIASDVFVYLFLVEFVMKLLGLGPHQYFNNSWNCLDFTLVIVTLTPKVIPSMSGLGWLRIIRLLRVVHLARRLPGIGNMIQAIVLGVPQIVTALIIMLIVFFMYAVIGMNLFGGMENDGTVFLSDKVNFQTFWNSLLTLSRCATGESFNGIMNDLSWCPSGVGCEFQHVAAPYMISFIIIARFLLLNIVLAMILESYVDIVKKNDVLDQRLIQQFRTLWMKGDPRGHGYLPLLELRHLLVNLEHPLGYQRTQQNMTVCQLVPYIQSLNLNVYVCQGSDNIIELFGRKYYESTVQYTKRRGRQIKLSEKTSNHIRRNSSFNPYDIMEVDPETVMCFCVHFQDVLQALSARSLLLTTRYEHTRFSLENIRVSLEQAKKARNRKFTNLSLGSTQIPSSSGGLSSLNKGSLGISPQEIPWDPSGISRMITIAKRGVSRRQKRNTRPDFILEDCDASWWMAVHAIEAHWIGRNVHREFVGAIARAKAARKLNSTSTPNPAYIVESSRRSSSVGNLVAAIPGIIKKANKWRKNAHVAASRSLSITSGVTSVEGKPKVLSVTRET